MWQMTDDGHPRLARTSLGAWPDTANFRRTTSLASWSGWRSNRYRCFRGPRSSVRDHRQRFLIAHQRRLTRPLPRFDNPLVQLAKTLRGCLESRVSRGRRRLCARRSFAARRARTSSLPTARARRSRPGGSTPPSRGRTASRAIILTAPRRGPRSSRRPRTTTPSLRDLSFLRLESGQAAHYPSAASRWKRQQPPGSRTTNPAASRHPLRWLTAG